MLIYNFHAIGNRLLSVRKRIGMTQAEVAEAAGLADRTYADIERGTVNMRMETLLRICNVLHITPDDILTEKEQPSNATEEEIIALLKASSPHEKETALKILKVYLQS